MQGHFIKMSLFLHIPLEYLSLNSSYFSNMQSQTYYIIRYKEHALNGWSLALNADIRALYAHHDALESV